MRAKFGEPSPADAVPEARLPARQVRASDPCGHIAGWCRAARDVRRRLTLRWVTAQRVLENPDRWAKLSWSLDLATFIKRLDDLRMIRNNVMHFNPEPLPANTVDRLRYMLKPLRDFGG